LSTLSIETKFKLIVLLAKKMDFIKPEDARHHYLTQPPQRIKKSWTHCHSILLLHKMYINLQIS